MSKPLIGITAGEVVNRDYPWLPVTYGQRHPFTDSVITAGGLPIITPLSEDMSVIEEIANRLDGLVLSGGNDIDPRTYGQKPGNKIQDASLLRDKVEAKIIKNALKSGIPILGLCRGMQMINVYFGGNLYQDIGDELPDALNHESSNITKNLADKAHTIDIDKDSKLHKIIGKDTVYVNTHHHQAIKDLGKGLRITARSEDRIVEALETDDDKFIIGIQSHPESLGVVIPEWRKLFEDFVAEAKTKMPSSHQSSA